MQAIPRSPSPFIQASSPRADPVNPPESTVTKQAVFESGSIPNQCTTTIATLGAKNLLEIVSFLGPTNVVLVSGVSKSFHTISTTSIDSPAFVDRMSRYLGIQNAEILRQLKNRTPPTRAFLKRFAHNHSFISKGSTLEKRHLEALRNFRKLLTPPAFTVMFRTLCAVLSLRQLQEQAGSGPKKHKPVEDRDFFNLCISQFIAEFTGVLHCHNLRICVSKGLISFSDAILLPESVRRHLRHNYVVELLINHSITFSDLSLADDRTVKRWLWHPSLIPSL